MAPLQNLPIGIQDFESLREDGYLYVDKTEPIWRLTHTGRYYFLSRPRRFGKSLLMSTIKAYYEGKRELFDGLYIATVEKEWKQHPVLLLDLNTNKYDSKEVLETKLNESLSEWEDLYDCRRPDLPFGMRFEKVIRRAHEVTGRRVVILVDEYDKPLLQAIEKPELQEEYRSTLKGFYGALKSSDGSIQFAMLTGVTKFGKVSVFSDLNNLEDISMSEHYYDICGISEQELLTYFNPHTERLAQINGVSKDEAIALLRKNYDGYHFEANAPGIYNPFSVLNTLKEGRLKSYWFETGTPIYLVQLLQEHEYNLEEMASADVTADVINSVDIASPDPIPVIYQSGYLTIKDYDERFDAYILGFPNKEVEEGFVKYLLPWYSDRMQGGRSAFDIRQFVHDVETGRVEQFLQRLRSLFADTPYELIRNLENHYQNVLWILYKLCGFYTQAKYHTSQGRIDLCVQTPKYCYVMEFKLDGTAEEALEQISEKNYTLPFEQNGQTVTRIGMNFSKETRNIERWVIA